MAALANIALTNTFDTWRIRTNQAVTRLNAHTLSESVFFGNTLYANVAFIAKSAANVNFIGTGVHLNLKSTKLANTVSLIGGSRLLAGHETTTGSNPHDHVNKNTAAYRWLRNTGTTSQNFALAANTGLGTNSDSIRQIVPTANGEMQLFWAGAARLGGWFKFESNGMGLLLSGVSTADHAAPAADRVEIYTKKSVGGETDPTLKIRFNTGLPKTIAAPFSAIDLPAGTTAQRPSPVANGAIRYNTSLTKFEAYKDSAWVGIVDSNIQDPGNPIINGSMDVWQRGVVFTSPASLQYMADRWMWENSPGPGLVTVNRTTNVPTFAQAGVIFNYALEVDVTTADSSLAAADVYCFMQRIEGCNWRHFAQRAFTISFWVTDTIIGQHSVRIVNIDGSRSCIGTYTVLVADSWEYKTVTFPASPSSGTWNYTTDIGIGVVFSLGIGSNYLTTPGSWQNGNFYGATGDVNSMSSASNYFRLTGVKMELGSAATPLQYRSFPDELALCQRYFEKTYAYNDVIGTVNGNNCRIDIQPWTHVRWGMTMLVQKRATPTIVIYAPSHGVVGSISDDSTGTSHVAPTYAAGDQSFMIFATFPGAYQQSSAHWTASAEL